MLNIRNFIDDAKCFETVRILRWPEGVRCVHCLGIDKQARSGCDAARAADESLQGLRRWFDDEVRDSNVIEVLLGRLRRKLDPDGSLAPIETLRGRGFRLARSIPKTRSASIATGWAS